MKATMDAIEFKILINKVKKYVGKTNSNKIMTYIHLIVDACSNSIRAEAVDGHRFSVAYGNLLDTDGDSFECFLQPDIMPRITKRDRNEIKIEMVGNKLLLSVKDQIVGYVQPDGQFFDLDKLINVEIEPTFRIGFNASLLAESLKSVLSSSRNNQARLYFYGESSLVLIRSNERDVAGVLPLRISEDTWRKDVEFSKSVKKKS